MIRVSMMYPVTDGATFDLDYYKTTHMGDIVNKGKCGAWLDHRERRGPRPSAS